MRVGPPLVRVSVMYHAQDGVLRVLRSAGPALVFGGMSEGMDGRETIEFVFDQQLDAKFTSGDPIYLVIWKYYDNGLVTQAVGRYPVEVQPPFQDEWGVILEAEVGLDKRQWKTRQPA